MADIKIKQNNFTHLQSIEGFIRTVSVAPTWTPRKFSEQFIVYNDGSNDVRFYVYDTEDNAWRYVSLGNSSSFTIATDTNGTTAVSVFGSSGLGVDATITGVYLISKDTTAGNITVENPAATTVATIAKGTTAGTMVGATSLSNTAVSSGTNVVVDSSSAGNATVFITYEIN